MTKEGIIIAVTGGMGSGKTTVARLLAGRGLPILELDDVILGWYSDPTCPVFQAIVGAFGERVLKDGVIDRDLLRHYMRSENRRDELASIETPALLQAIRTFRSEHALGIMVGSRIIDAGLPFDLLILVEAPEDVRRRRIKERSDIADETIDLILAQQGDYNDCVDWIFPNDGDLAQLTDLVTKWDECWREYVTDPSSYLYSDRLSAARR